MSSKKKPAEKKPAKKKPTAKPARAQRPAQQTGGGPVAWILKTEPETYSWDDLVRDGKTTWDLVRNYTARNNLQAMKAGDRCYIYHSVGPKTLVGVAEVTKAAFPDPSAAGDEAGKGWVAVEIKPKAALTTPVSLADMKKNLVLSKMVLVRQSRLSVCPVTAAEEQAILALAQ